ncbi:4-deoxy-L-threo-5-hexosulose-uronate ketol-isomerase 1 [Bacteroidia bacterium]|nr:4-deoxy-L-threo-5-hexosulose-uronate ketol-isomerase 1 [Bacteroidia bacterium]
MTDCKLRYASSPADAVGYDTDRLREEFLIERVMTPGQICLTCSMFDRMIAGGAMPVGERLELEAVDLLRSERFTSRREVGIINVGGAGTVTVDGRRYELDFKEALYVGRGEKRIFFESADAAKPAMFYLNSAPAHCEYPDRKITRADAVVMEAGSAEGSNHRIINRMIVKEVVPTCQLQMGMTELKTGSVWNTMPAHTHDRRMEVYFYFELPADHSVCHFMGQPQQTRHIWMQNLQGVISPSWSIHSACGTAAYTFIWGMCGENLDYNDMDGCPTNRLK